MRTLEKRIVPYSRLHTAPNFREAKFLQLECAKFFVENKFSNQGFLIATQRSVKHFASLTFAVKDAAAETAKFMPLKNRCYNYGTPTSMLTRISAHLQSLHLREWFT